MRDKEEYRCQLPLNNEEFSRQLSVITAGDSLMNELLSAFTSDSSYRKKLELILAFNCLYKGAAARILTADNSVEDAYFSITGTSRSRSEGAFYRRSPVFPHIKAVIFYLPDTVDNTVLDFKRNRIYHEIVHLFALFRNILAKLRYGRFQYNDRPDYPYFFDSEKEKYKTFSAVIENHFRMTMPKEHTKYIDMLIQDDAETYAVLGSLVTGDKLKDFFKSYYDYDMYLIDQCTKDFRYILEQNLTLPAPQPLIECDDFKSLGIKKETLDKMGCNDADEAPYNESTIFSDESLKLLKNALREGGISLFQSALLTLLDEVLLHSYNISATKRKYIIKSLNFLCVLARTNSMLTTFFIKGISYAVKRMGIPEKYISAMEYGLMGLSNIGLLVADPIQAPYLALTLISSIAGGMAGPWLTKYTLARLGTFSPKQKIDIFATCYKLVDGDTANYKPFFDALADKKYSTALRCACTTTNKKAFTLIKKLIEYKKILGININEQSESNQRSALHYAAIKSTEEVYKFLIDKGALNSIKDNTGTTPADYADKHLKTQLTLSTSTSHHL